MVTISSCLHPSLISDISEKKIYVLKALNILIVFKQLFLEYIFVDVKVISLVLMVYSCNKSVLCVCGQLNKWLKAHVFR